MKDARERVGMLPDRRKSILLPALVLLLISHPGLAQTLDPVLPRVSPSEQALDALRRTQGEERRRALESEQFRFDSNALRSRELFERSLPAPPLPPCTPGEPGCR